MKNETLREFFDRKSKLNSPFEVTNKELADARFCDDVDFKSKEEKGKLKVLLEVVLK